MEVDKELLVRAEAGSSSVRLYDWDQVWVTLGRHQVPAEALVNANGVGYTIRPTGGAAVLHGHDLTVAVALPLSFFQEALVERATEGRRSLNTLYRVVATPLVAALRSCGVDADFADQLGQVASGAPPARSADCFASNAKFDVVDIGSQRKLAGCAMRVTRRAVLLQASVPIRAPVIAASTLILGAKDALWVHWNSAEFGDAFLAEWERLTKKSPLT